MCDKQIVLIKVI